MDEKPTSVLGRTTESLGEPGGTEEIAAAVALAIDRGRRAPRSMAPPFKSPGTAGPDEWATSGRLAQVNRFPARDPWTR
jgi:hypothetical protein